MIGKEKVKKHWYVISCIIIAISLLAYAYAFMVTWSSPVYVVTTDPNIKVYWDSDCTDPVTSIDFGDIQQGAWITKTLYVKNEGGGQVKIYWNSTISTATSDIQDWWGTEDGRPFFGHSSRNLNDYPLSGGSVMITWYHILVDPEINITSYSWTLTLGSGAA